jgi:hypothetical protein
VRLTVEIDGEHVPLDDCGWMLVAPCKCTVAIMLASWDGHVRAADEDAAWWEFYEDERPRRKKIEKAKRDGYTVALTTRNKASEAFGVRCPHDGGGSRG